MASVLIIDDDETIRSVMKRKLVAAGHQVRETGNGKHAAGLVAEAQVDLVITDIIMPNIEGIEIIRELKKEYPKIKIIAMSGGGRNTGEDYLGWAKNFGADATLAKPFKFEELLKAIAALV